MAGGDRPHPLDPHLAQLVTDVGRLEEDLRWAYADAWWPTSVDPSAPRRSSGGEAATPAADPDQVRGPKYALGVGDDLSRAALQAVVAELARLELRLAAAVFFAGVRREQPPLAEPDGFSSVAVIDRTFAGVRWRLRVLGEDGSGLGSPRLSVVRGHVRAAARHADRAVRQLARALNRGESGGMAHAEPKCRICGIRPQATRERQVRMPNGDRRLEARPSKGGRCDTCAQWFSRNGNERPRDLDAVDDALAAAARRRGRGEGWGSA